MSAESNRNTALIIVMSVLGVLAIALVGGLVLMQQSSNTDSPAIAALSPQDRVVEDSFDPISWAREGAAYPPLDEIVETVPGVVDYTRDGSTTEVDDLPAPVVSTQADTVAPSAPVEPEVLPAAVETTTYREVRENAWWVQVFSSGNIGKAEEVRDALVGRGLPATVQVREVDGQTWYRVRIGAFSVEDEAERYVETVRALPGYEGSYVVQAPVTRRVAE